MTITESTVPYPAMPSECHLCGSAINVEKLPNDMLRTCRCGFHAFGTITGMIIWNMAKNQYDGINKVIPNTYRDEVDEEKIDEIMNRLSSGEALTELMGVR